MTFSQGCRATRTARSKLGGYVDVATYVVPGQCQYFFGTGSHCIPGCGMQLVLASLRKHRVTGNNREFCLDIYLSR